MPNSPISQDPRAVVADIAVDIEAAAMRDEIAATYPPAPAPRKTGQ